MSVRTTCLIGFGFLLLAAPAHATPCKHRFGEHGDSRGAERHASSIQLERTRPDERGYALRSPVDSRFAELSGLSKNEHGSAHPAVPSENDDPSSSDSGNAGPPHSRPEMPFQSAIPEPTAMALFGLGLLFTQVARRRRESSRLPW